MCLVYKYAKGESISTTNLKPGRKFAAFSVIRLDLKFEYGILKIGITLWE